MTTALSALKFFYERVLQREWAEFNLVRPRPEKKLPVVLSVEEVQRLLQCVEGRRYRACLSVLYSCGLRLREGTHLRVSQIDSQRMMLHIQGAKGGYPLGGTCWKRASTSGKFRAIWAMPR